MCKCARVENGNRMATAAKQKIFSFAHRLIWWIHLLAAWVQMKQPKIATQFSILSGKIHTLEYITKNGRENSGSIEPHKTLKTYLNYFRPRRFGKRPMMQSWIVLKVANIQEDRRYPMPIGSKKCKCSSGTNAKFPTLNYAIEKFLFHEKDFALMHKIYENYIW